MTSKVRGRFFLDMLNATSQIILIDRFNKTNTSIPATLVRNRTDSHTGNPIRIRTIVDYFTINKHHWARVNNCTVHTGSWMNIGYIAHAIDSNSCDHELLTLSIDVPTRDIPQGMEYRYKPPRKRFLTHKLIDKNTKKAYQKALSKKSESLMKQMKALRDSHQKGHISKQTLANAVIRTRSLPSTYKKQQNHI